MTEAYRGGGVLAEVVRSDFVEGFHRGSVVVLDATGSVRDSIGDIEAPVFPRSANKPMQTLGALRSGLPFTGPAELALASASHRGEPFHVAAVQDLLRRADLPPDALGCPAEWPIDEDARDTILRAGGTKTRLTMNCSGKHAAMLATCRAAGWSISDYLRRDHPLQLANVRATEDLTGYPIAHTGIDGCGAPLFAYPLLGLARAFQRLVDAEPGSHERAIADGMRSHPELVSGTKGFDTRIMRAVPGLLAKIGAEGIQAIAVPGLGSVAVKIDDGNKRAATPVAVAALRSLELSTLDIDKDVLDELATEPLHGGGTPDGTPAVVGTVRPVWPHG